MNVILFDEPTTKLNLLPFTFTRPVSEIRVGILTIKEKWEKWFPADYSFHTDQYLAKKYPLHKTNLNLYINGCVLPHAELIDAIKLLEENEVLTNGLFPIAFYGSIDAIDDLYSTSFKKNHTEIIFDKEVTTIEHLYDIFLYNRSANIQDYRLLTYGRKSQKINDPHTIVYNAKDVFIEDNVTIKAAILNAENGPIYVGENTTIGEGSRIRGASSIGSDSILNINTRIVGDTTIGPSCKVGGEISNSVIFGFSSKSHDGFLGNSVLGEWCNVGADTNTSNLKNNYKDVRIWNYKEEKYIDTGRQFCGLMMGDHSKCGINTMFNTGTVVGVSANIFGSGFPATFIPSFSWGGADGITTYQFDKAIEVMPKVLVRRKKQHSQEDEEILKHIFEITKKFRQQ